MATAHGSKQRDVALVWRGYIEALRESNALSDDEHAAVADLLPEFRWDLPVVAGLARHLRRARSSQCHGLAA
jgi:hypothetical protein